MGALETHLPAMENFDSKKYTPEELEKQASRVQSDTRLIADGAHYVQDEDIAEPRLSNINQSSHYIQVAINSHENVDAEFEEIKKNPYLYFTEKYSDSDFAKFSFKEVPTNKHQEKKIVRLSGMLSGRTVSLEREVRTVFLEHESRLTRPNFYDTHGEAK